MKIDAHHHVWDLSVRDQSWITGDAMAPIRRDFSIDDLVPLAADASVDASVLVQTIPVPEETPEFLALAEQSDLIAAVVGWVDLASPAVADHLSALLNAPGGHWLRGIRHPVQGEPDPHWLARPDVRRGLQAVADAGLGYDLLVLAHQLPAAIDTVAALPNLRFVLDHCAKPPIAAAEIEPWATDLRTLAAHDNVVCKLSGLVTEAGPDWSVADLRPYADIVLEAFGPNRLMFGSDWPVCLLAATYPDVLAAAETLAADLTDAERESVFTTTARTAYTISP